jgi:eukaryotic-like serine/threonine-protein kinase
MTEKRSIPRRPAKLGKYEILDGDLGSGGMGVVYKAYDPVLRRSVAIKQLTEGFRGNPDMLARFYEEAKQQASLLHNNIVTVFDAGDQDGDPYIVMQFVDGQTLDKTIKDRKYLDTSHILKVVEQVCHALAYAHRSGLVHRDVKPANIIVDSHGTAKLLDFGISRDDSRADQTRTHTGVMVGTPAYMAPERFKGIPIDGRSDLFSVGVVLYELLTGRRPFDGPDYTVIADQVMRFYPPAPSTLISNCPKSLDAIVTRALAKSSLDRYANGDEMALALHEAASDLTRGQVAELMAQAERLVEQRQYLPAQSALQKILSLDSQHIGAKRILQQVDQQITQRERERKARDLARRAQDAAADRDWPPALKFCDEALNLNPGSATLASLRQSILEGKEKDEQLSKLLFDIDKARKEKRWDWAITQANAARELDPNNSRVLALCRDLEREAEDQHLNAELQNVLTSFHEQLAERQFDDAALLLDRALTIAPENIEVLLAKEELANALADERRKALVRHLDDKMALSTDLDEFRAVQAELAEALAQFPDELTFFRLRRTLESRIQQLEDEQFVRETLKKTAGLPPEEALQILRQALTRVPGSQELRQREAELAKRVERTKRDRILGQRLAEARQLIDSGRPREAVTILQRTKTEGNSSRELDELLEYAKTAAGADGPYEPAAPGKKALDYEASLGGTQMFDGGRGNKDPLPPRPPERSQRRQTAPPKGGATAIEVAERLLKLGLFTEALDFLEGQPAEVKRVPEVDVAIRRAKLLWQGEEETFRLMGRCYAQLESERAIEDLRKMLTVEMIDDERGSRQRAKDRLRERCEQIYSNKASNAITSTRRFLSEDDIQGAEEMLHQALSWIDLAPPQLQEQVRSLHAEVSRGKKFLRFGRGSRR